MKQILPRLPQKKQSCWHSVLGFLVSELWDNTFLLFKSPSVWHSVMAALAHYSSEVELPRCHWASFLMEEWAGFQQTLVMASRDAQRGFSGSLRNAVWQATAQVTTPKRVRWSWGLGGDEKEEKSFGPTWEIHEKHDTCERKEALPLS